MKEPIYTVNKNDFRFEHFVGTGKGGQNRNKRHTCVRIIHIESGYFASACEERSQHQNLLLAFNKLCKDKRFILWLKNKALKVEDVEKQVDVMMQESNLKIEIKQDNKWVLSPIPLA